MAQLGLQSNFPRHSFHSLLYLPSAAQQLFTSLRRATSTRPYASEARPSLVYQACRRLYPLSRSTPADSRPSLVTSLRPPAPAKSLPRLTTCPFVTTSLRRFLQPCATPYFHPAMEA